VSVPHSICELIGAVGETYGSIDIRSVAVREGDSWVNVMAVVRLTYEDVSTAAARLSNHLRRFPPVQTDTLRIDAGVRPMSEWPQLCSEVKEQGFLRIGDSTFKLRQKRDVASAGGNFQWGYFEFRAFDNRSWPAIAVKFDIGGMTPIAEARFAAVAHLLGYADAFEAANHLCEWNVSQQNHGCDFAIWVPFFATISTIRIQTPEKRVCVGIQRHSGLSDVRAIVSLRGPTTYAGEPFREQKEISGFNDETKGQVVSAAGFVQVDQVGIDDWIQVRLLHPKIGEIKRDENAVRMLIPPAERNVLLEALRLFCADEKLDDLLVRAYDAIPPRLNESAAFELHVSWLLSLFELSPIILGHLEHIVAPHTKVRRSSVDLLAASQARKLLLVVACTLGPPKAEDFSNLRNARNILAREVFGGTGVSVIPVLFTSATGCPAYDLNVDSFDFVPIVDADQMQNLLRILRDGQESRFIEFLTQPNLNRLGEHSQP
jgi:hypothetical protein